ncbi:MAG: response regulator [Bacteroidales bacterium]|nr:response regulator [Bacteroidales bacterium]
MKNKKLILSKNGISILIISIVLIALAIIFAVWNNNKFKDEIISSTQKNLSIKAEIIAAGIENLMLEYTKTLQALANDPFVINALLHNHGHEFYPEYCPLENIFSAHSEELAALMLISGNGTLIHRYPLITDSLSFSFFREDVNSVLQNHRAHISGIYFNIDGKSAVGVSYPVFYQERFIGIIRFTVLVETFIEHFISPTLDENTFAIGMDNQGILFHKPYQEFTKKTIYDFFNEDKEKYPEYDFSKRQEMLIKSVRGEAGTAVYSLTNNTGQFTKMIMAYWPINIIDGIYSISLYTDYNTILRSVRQYTVKSYTFILLIVLLFVFVVFRLFNEQIKLQIEAKFFKNIAEKAEEINKQKNEFEALYEEYKTINKELIFAKEKSEKNELRYKTLVENLGEGLIIVDIDETIIFTNPVAEKIFETKNVVGRNLREFVSGDHFKLIQNHTEKRIKGKKSSYEIDIILHDNIKKSILLTGTPLFEGEKVVQTLGLFRDITKIKKAENAIRQKNEELQAAEEELMATNDELRYVNSEQEQNNLILKIAKEKAEESSKLKSAFLANLSHEIRTPMNGINGFSKLLCAPNLNEENKKLYTKLIQQSSEQLLSIINDILDISKIETGQIEIRKNAISINELLSSLYKSFLVDARIKNVDLSYTKTLSDDQCIILLDENKIMRILSNLINNALKFTKEGYVEFGYLLKNNFLEFFVKDTGIGISPEDQDKIFERFRQLEFSLSRNYGGTGLGLSISKELVNLLGGEIWVNSELNKLPDEKAVGSVFYFTIPYEQVKDVYVKKEQDGIAEFPDWSKFTILIAEDEKSNLLYLQEVLNVTDVKLFHARNGEEAVQICKDNDNIDLVLMDVKMPIMNGFEATKAIKRIKPKLPIIAQTAYAMAGDRNKALQLGCDDYISKPTNDFELIKIIGKNINKVCK